MNKISTSAILTTLNELHLQSKNEYPKILKGMAKAMFRELQPADMKDAYIAISKQQGEFIYDLILEKKAKNIIEFGTSFGISTLYLAAAAKATNGKVITTELLDNKCKIAAKNFKKAGLSEYIDLREGDALETLKVDVPDNIDFLLLDGWNNLYLPLLKLLEPKFKKGTLIYTDNASFKSTKPFLEYVKANTAKYKTVSINADKGDAELSEFLGVSFK